MLAHNHLSYRYYCDWLSVGSFPKWVLKVMQYLKPALLLQLWKIECISDLEGEIMNLF